MSFRDPDRAGGTSRASRIDRSRRGTCYRMGHPSVSAQRRDTCRRPSTEGLDQSSRRIRNGRGREGHCTGAPLLRSTRVSTLMRVSQSAASTTGPDGARDTAKNASGGFLLKYGRKYAMVQPEGDCACSGGSRDAQARCTGEVSPVGANAIWEQARLCRNGSHS
jgi:hypothetical protein